MNKIYGFYIIQLECLFIIEHIRLIVASLYSNKIAFQASHNTEFNVGNYIT